MIIGRDLMNKLRMIVKFNNKNLIWDGVIVPMWRSGDNFPNPTLRRSKINQAMQRTADTKVTKEATEIIVEFIDSKYKKANLEEISQSAHQLDATEQVVLPHLLKYFEDLFDGTLGKRNTYPVEIDLKPYAKPLSGRYYPVPHINKETFRKELTSILEISVLTPTQQSEHGTTVLIISKKEGTVIFITDFWKANNIIVRKNYPIPRIGDMMQQLEGFQFATALDINMGYYTISLDAKSKDINTMVMEFGKFQ